MPRNRSSGLIPRCAAAVTLALLLIQSSLALSQQATLQDNIFTIPYIVFNEKFYRVELSLIAGTEPAQFELLRDADRSVMEVLLMMGVQGQVADRARQFLSLGIRLDRRIYRKTALRLPRLGPVGEGTP